MLCLTLRVPRDIDDGGARTDIVLEDQEGNIIGRLIPCRRTGNQIRMRFEGFKGIVINRDEYREEINERSLA